MPLPHRVPRIFITYRRSDSAGTTGRIRERLELVFGRRNVFQDVEAIGAGSVFLDAITTGIGRADVQLVVIGPTWLTATGHDGGRRLDAPDDYVAKEIETGLVHGLRIIPILVDDAALPLSADLPERLRPILARNARSIRDTRFDDDVRELISQLGPERPLYRFVRARPLRAAVWCVALVVALTAVVLQRSHVTGNDIPAEAAVVRNANGTAGKPSSNALLATTTSVSAGAPVTLMGNPAAKRAAVVLAGPDGIDENADALYIADPAGSRVYRRAADGSLAVVAGTGRQGYDGDGPATEVRLFHPTAVAVDTSGNIWIADNGNRLLRMVARDGQLVTKAGVPQNNTFAGEGDASRVTLNPKGLAFAADGDLYVSDPDNHRVLLLHAGRLTTVAGTTADGKPSAGCNGDGVATERQLNAPMGVAVDANGSLYIADFGNNLVRKVTPDGSMTTIAGGGCGQTGAAQEQRLIGPSGVAVAANGSLYIAEYGGNRVRRLDPDGTLTTVAGSGDKSAPDGDGPATARQLSQPTNVEVAHDGSVYISEFAAGRVRRLSADGRLTTIVG